MDQSRCGVTLVRLTRDWGHCGGTKLVPRPRSPGWDGDTQFIPHGSPLLGQVTMNATVEMTTKIDNRNFTEALLNPFSSAYMEFEQEFQEKVRAQRHQGRPQG